MGRALLLGLTLLAAPAAAQDCREPSLQDALRDAFESSGQDQIHVLFGTLDFDPSNLPSPGDASAGAPPPVPARLSGAR